MELYHLWEEDMSGRETEGQYLPVSLTEAQRRKQASDVSWADGTTLDSQELGNAQELVAGASGALWENGFCFCLERKLVHWGWRKNSVAGHRPVPRSIPSTENKTRK